MLEPITPFCDNLLHFRGSKLHQPKEVSRNVRGGLILCIREKTESIES